MKFFFAKSEHTCFYCRLGIPQGNAFTRLTISTRQGGKMGLLFHPVCYPKWSEAQFNRNFLNWRKGQNPPRKKGRPRKYKDTKIANKLLALLCYHKKTGNGERVVELETKLKEVCLGDL